MAPLYDLNKIKFGTDGATFERAVELYEAGKVTKFKNNFAGFSAVVVGSKPYQVLLDSAYYDRGTCECYLGQNDTLCKHMVAVAIRAVMQGKSLSQKEKKFIEEPQCSGILGTLSEKSWRKPKLRSPMHCAISNRIPGLRAPGSPIKIPFPKDARGSRQLFPSCPSAHKPPNF